MEFAGENDYKKLGLVFCAGLAKRGRHGRPNPRDPRFRSGLRGLPGWGRAEAKTLASQTKNRSSGPGLESMCNPVPQPGSVNEAGATDFISSAVGCARWAADSMYFKSCHGPHPGPRAVKDGWPGITRSPCIKYHRQSYSWVTEP